MDPLAGMSDDSEEDTEEGHTGGASAADSQPNKSTGEHQFHSCKPSSPSPITHSAGIDCADSTKRSLINSPVTDRREYI